MRPFSHRKGLKPIKTSLQVKSMDTELRARLWSNMVLFYWEKIKRTWQSYSSEDDKRLVVDFFRRVWHSYFKKPIDI